MSINTNYEKKIKQTCVSLIHYLENAEASRNYTVWMGPGGRPTFLPVGCDIDLTVPVGYRINRDGALSS